LFVHNQYIPHVANVCGATGMDFQEDRFPASRESHKNLFLRFKSSADNYCRITK